MTLPPAVNVITIELDRKLAARDTCLFSQLLRIDPQRLKLDRIAKRLSDLWRY